MIEENFIQEPTWRKGPFLLAIVRVREGETFYVAEKYIPKGIERLVEKERIENHRRWNWKLRALTNLVAVVEGVSASREGVSALRFMRAERAYKVARFGRLIRPENLDLKKFNQLKVHVIGGAWNAAIYDDELLLPNRQGEVLGWILTPITTISSAPT